jgi:hypothetical protein
MLGREGEMQESNKGKNTWLFLGHTIVSISGWILSVDWLYLSITQNELNDN